jgi:hypothetical protein
MAQPLPRRSANYRRKAPSRGKEGAARRPSPLIPGQSGPIRDFSNIKQGSNAFARLSNVGWFSMEKSITNLATIAGFVLALLIAVWNASSGLARLETRIETLEAQVSTYSTGIALSRESATNADASSAKPFIVDPIKARCADLAAQFAKAAEDNASLTVGRPIEGLMEKLGCFK